MSIIEKLPKILEQGRRTAEQILESLEGKQRISIQTRELVTPAKEVVIKDIFRSPAEEKFSTTGMSRLIYGDNLLVMAALLAENDSGESLRGKIDLIYIDPPFDSKADYRTKVKLPNVDIEQKPTVIEQYAYGDTWSEGTISYLRMMIPRFILMRELLKDSGSIYVHLDWHVVHYVKIILDEIFGKENLTREIIWSFDTKSGYKSAVDNWVRSHDTILYHSKNPTERYFQKQYLPYSDDYLSRFKKIDEDGTLLS